MGLFFRKSKKFGLLKLNLSKSGIGFSFGIKGFRITKNSKGTQINAGVNGIYYRKSLNAKTPKLQEQGNQEAIEQENGIPEKSIIVYQSPELQKFTRILFAQIALTTTIFILFLLLKSIVLCFITLFIGGLSIFKFIKSHPDEYSEFKEQGNKIKELQNQNFKVEIRQGYDPQTKEAIEKRNKSKYQKYKYSYETYKKN